MSIVLIRSMILYIVVVFGVRLMGKRQIGELQPAELVITILISNIATLPLEDPGIPLANGILPILSLVSFEILVSWITLKSNRMRRLFSGRPKIIIRDGQIEQATMQDLRLSVDDLMTALRGNQIFDPSEVQFAIVETTGNISIYPKADSREVTQGDLNLNNPSENPPSILIEDGYVMHKALAMIGQNHDWLYQKLAEHRLTVQEVFLMTGDSNGKCVVIPKKRGKQQ